jgi:RNA polymerase sigma factor (sigma-70 family)
VALHALRTSLRRARRRHVAEAGAAPVRAFVVPEVDVDLWALVASLSERQRTAIVLRYVADLGEADIATAMGIRRGTVAATLHQARAHLRDAMRPERGKDDDNEDDGNVMRSEHG